MIATKAASPKTRKLMYRVQRINDIHHWLDDESRWNSLAGASLFRQWAWQTSWWNHFGKAFIPYFLMVTDSADRICGFVPWMMTKNRHRCLQFLGSGQACSDGLSVLALPHCAVDIGYAVADWLVDQNNESDQWNELDLDGVLHGDPAMAALVQRLVERGVWCQSESRASSWFLPTTQGLETYLSEFGKTRRRQFRQHLQRLNTHTGLACTVAHEQSRMSNELNGLIELHQKRWTAVGQPGTYSDPAFRSFIHQAAELLLLRDQLRLVSLKRDAQLVAAQLQFITTDQRLAIYSSGMALDQAELEPGRLIDAHTIAHAMANKLNGIDYLRGDEPYKANLHARPTPIVRVKAFAKHRYGQLERRLYQSTFGAKQWIRRKRGRETVQVLTDLQGTPSVPFQKLMSSPEPLFREPSCDMPAGLVDSELGPVAVPPVTAGK